MSILLAPLGANAQSDDSTSSGGTAPEAAEPLHPPRVRTQVQPVYPTTHATFGLTPAVAMHVTVEPDGAVGDVHLEHPGDVEFDDAAIAAVRQWTFEAARRGETPIRSRVRVELTFYPPASAAAPAPTEDSSQHSDADDEHEHELAPPRELGEPPPTEYSLAPARTAPSFHARADDDPLATSRAPRGASHYEVGADLLEAAPHRDGADLLSSAPGVYVARPEGDAVAQQIYLRGFDAEHGQDIELTVGGGVMPINQPSHLHGQGYADLGFIIPEAVRSLRVIEGISDPRQGDFATAGSIDIDLGVTRRGLRGSLTYGSFDTWRALMMWAPRGEREETFFASTFRTSSGFGANRSGQSGGAMGQWSFGDGPLRGRIFGAFWGARHALAGFLRRDDIDAGRVGFLGVYDDPSARAQSALSARAHLGGVLEWRGDKGAFAEASLYVQWTDFRLQANYTGYTQRSQTHADWVGRGDLIEQRNELMGLGLRARYRTERWEPWTWLRAFAEAGLQSRVDSIGQSQSLLDAGQNETWDVRADATVRAVDVGAYFDLDLHITDYVRLRGGARADVLFYDVDDRLGNFIPDERRETYIVGYRRSASGLVAGPRVSLEVTPVAPLVLAVTYGEGYRSPQARQLQDGESAPFATVRSGDVGFRLGLWDQALKVSGSGFLTSVTRPFRGSAGASRTHDASGGRSLRGGEAASRFYGQRIGDLRARHARCSAAAHHRGPCAPLSARAGSTVRASMGRAYRSFGGRRGRLLRGLRAGRSRGARRLVPITAPVAFRNERGARVLGGCQREGALELAGRGRRGPQRLGLAVRGGRGLIRLVLGHERGAFATAGATCFGRCAPDHSCNARSDSMRRAAWLAATLLAGCDGSGGAVFEVPVIARGVGDSSVAGADGWTFTLERAEMGFGPVYACSTEAASPEFCPEAVLEVREVLSIDALAPESQVGVARARTAVANTAMWDYGITWLPTAGQARALEGAPEGHSFVFVGRARHTDGREVAIDCALDVLPPMQGSVAVTGKSTGAHPLEPGSRLRVSVDAVRWWSVVSFESIAARAVDGHVTLNRGDAEYDALLRTVESGIGLRFDWPER
jgi:iron complex outermembrane recepter protein